jgi:glycosyltransferase involved in cell wall biosynthesis
MRIAIILPGFSKDAADWAIPALQVLTLELARTHEVTVFSLRYPPAGRYEIGGINHFATGGGTRFGFSSLGIIWQTVKNLVERHHQRAFDSLHAFWADEAGLTALLAGARLGLPAIVSLAGGELTYLADIGYGTQGSKIRGWLTRMTIRRAATLTAGSNYQMQLAIEAGATPQKLHLVPLGVDTKRFSPAAGPGPERPTMIQAASLVAVKNQALLLEVLEKVRLQIPDIRLRLVGSGPLEKHLRHLADQAGLNQHIIWQGAVPFPEMPAHYQAAQIYLQSSRHESQGMAVLEAMACGLPVIGTPVGILPEVAARPATSDPEILARQVVELFSQTDALQSLRLEARKTIVANYDLTHSTSLFVNLYDTGKTSVTGQ